jgi:5'-nucleotidase
MRILLTNDDGIHAQGLDVLEEIARTLSDDIWVVWRPTSREFPLNDPLRA